MALFGAMRWSNGMLLRVMLMGSLYLIGGGKVKRGKKFIYCSDHGMGMKPIFCIREMGVHLVAVSTH